MNPTQHTISTTQKRNRTISVCGSTCTGKEKDAESGYHYFGARYYDSEALTGWLSVDPMSDKYPSLSPYNYCAGNPVKLVDPNGEEFTKFKDENGQLLEVRKATKFKHIIGLKT